MAPLESRRSRHAGSSLAIWVRRQLLEQRQARKNLRNVEAGFVAFSNARRLVGCNGAGHIEVAAVLMFRLPVSSLRRTA
jgi:hypothetical protein